MRSRDAPAEAARPAGGLRADYGFVATMDRLVRRDPERYVGYGITDSWDEIVETLQGAPRYTSTLMEDRGWHPGVVWRRAWYSCDLAHGGVYLYQTTVYAQTPTDGGESQSLQLGPEWSTPLHGQGDRTLQGSDDIARDRLVLTGTAGTRWRSCTAGAARGGW
ncbi:hypothetical protein Tco_0658269 [Tanacetum coccineum]